MIHRNSVTISIIVLAVISFVMFSFFKNSPNSGQSNTDAQQADYSAYSKLYVAGGCFWCVEADMEKLDGVVAVISGYAGGQTPNPTYENHADHREVVEVVYDPNKVSLTQVVTHFMTHHDATDEGGSFYDRGHSYTSAIHYQNDEEKQVIDEVIMGLEKAMVFEKPIVTAVEPFIGFTIAEDYHQDYYKINPIRYKGYRVASGRDGFVKKVVAKYEALADNLKPEGDTPQSNSDNTWQSYQKPSKDELKNSLSELAYYVTQEEGTERPYTPGSYDDNKADGIYVDILSGEPLYSSTHKFDSGTGWPSFTQPIDEEFIVEKTDYKLVWPRTEIRSRYGDNHLGHVFSDGPEPTGLRYCMNGASLLFIPLEEMEEKGYDDYLYLFN